MRNRNILFFLALGIMFTSPVAYTTPEAQDTNQEASGDEAYTRIIEWMTTNGFVHITKDLLEAIRGLELPSRALTDLPEDLGVLQKMKSLNAGNNNLTKLPESIVNLTNLETLLVHMNQISELPNDIGRLENLKILNLHTNALESLPESIGRLQTLEQLHLQKNQLTKLPNNIGDLNALHTLYLHGNPINMLPNSFAELTSLKTLIIPVGVQNQKLLVALQHLEELTLCDDDGTGLRTLRGQEAIQEYLLGLTITKGAY